MNIIASFVNRAMISFRTLLVVNGRATDRRSRSIYCKFLSASQLGAGCAAVRNNRRML